MGAYDNPAQWTTNTSGINRAIENVHAATRATYARIAKEKKEEETKIREHNKKQDTINLTAAGKLAKFDKNTESMTLSEDFRKRAHDSHNTITTLSLVRNKTSEQNKAIAEANLFFTETYKKEASTIVAYKDQIIDSFKKGTFSGANSEDFTAFAKSLSEGGGELVVGNGEWYGRYTNADGEEKTFPLDKAKLLKSSGTGDIPYKVKADLKDHTKEDIKLLINGENKLHDHLIGDTVRVEKIDLGGKLGWKTTGTLSDDQALNIQAALVKSSRGIWDDATSDERMDLYFQLAKKRMPVDLSEDDINKLMKDWGSERFVNIQKEMKSRKGMKAVDYEDFSITKINKTDYDTRQGNKRKTAKATKTKLNEAKTLKDHIKTKIKEFREHPIDKLNHWDFTVYLKAIDSPYRLKKKDGSFNLIDKENTVVSGTSNKSLEELRAYVTAPFPVIKK